MPRVDAAREHGYAMAALLVGIAIMGVMLSVAMPTWRTLVQREREEELIFRGEQYARAVGLYQRKYANAFPPNVEFLLERRFLRRRYRDPMTRTAHGEEGEFLLLRQTGGARALGTGTTPSGSSGTSTPRGQSRGTQPVATAGSGTTLGLSTTTAAGPQGGITGVVSRSTAASLRLYKGQASYNLWQFVWIPERESGGSRRGRPTGAATSTGPQRR